MEKERGLGGQMKACINKKCKDRYVSGTIWNNFCPRCGKPLYDTANKEVQKLIKEKWYKYKLYIL